MQKLDSLDQYARAEFMKIVVKERDQYFLEQRKSIEDGLNNKIDTKAS